MDARGPAASRLLPGRRQPRHHGQPVALLEPGAAVVPGRGEGARRRRPRADRAGGRPAAAGRRGAARAPRPQGLLPAEGRRARGPAPQRERYDARPARAGVPPDRDGVDRGRARRAALGALLLRPLPRPSPLPGHARVRAGARRHLYTYAGCRDGAGDAAPVLELGGERRIEIAFDVSAIPPGTRVAHATLWLHARDGGPEGETIAEARLAGGGATARDRDRAAAARASPAARSWWWSPTATVGEAGRGRDGEPAST